MCPLTLLMMMTNLTQSLNCFSLNRLTPFSARSLSPSSARTFVWCCPANVIEVDFSFFPIVIVIFTHNIILVVLQLRKKHVNSDIHTHEL